MCASKLVKVDLHGAIAGHSDSPVNPAGITFHGAMHAALPDVHCVMHLHTSATQAVCCLQDGLSFTNFYAAQRYGKVAYLDFEGITLHAEEGARILDSTQGRPMAVLLRNHGPVTAGHSLPQALALMWLVNRACEIWLAPSGVGALIPISVAVLKNASPTRCSSTRRTPPVRVRSMRCSGLWAVKMPATGTDGRRGAQASHGRPNRSAAPSREPR